ncbi:MAG: filamentous hemagglutinin N-terminal domain-containing protein [Phormidesmis sp.]
MTCKITPFYRAAHTGKNRFTLLSLSILFSSLAGGITPSLAQVNAQTNTDEPPIVVDSTLGDERSRLSTVGNRTNVTEGAQRGTNLFHSFERFNILDRQQSVYFMPDENIENILTRVVGSDPSNILGTLGVDRASSANLWLINPNGIVFGENARLDINGSFYATTASAIPMGTGTFNAVLPQNGQLLSVPPEASFANYLTADAGEIVSRGRLSNRSARANGSANSSAETTLTLAGSSITLEAGLNLGSDRALSLFANNNIETQGLIAKGANIDLTSANGAITVEGVISTNAAGEANAGNVEISAASDIETNGINARASSEETNTGQGGDITLSTTQGGNIRNRGNLNTESLAGTDSSQTENDDNNLLNAGNGGSIRLTTEAGGNIVNEGTLNSRSRSFNGNSSDGGDITLTTQRRGDITNEGVLRSQSDSDAGNTANGGDITLRTFQGNLLNQDALRASSDTNAGNAGNGGNISLQADRGSITNENDLATQSSTDDGDAGNGGKITLSAAGDISNQRLLNTYSFSEAGTAQSGGDISIESTGGGSITNRGTFRSLSASNAGDAGNGGSIEMSTVAAGSITHYGALNAQSLANGNVTGNAMAGGDVTLTTDDGDIVLAPLRPVTSANENGGSINTRSVTRSGEAGNGGTITVTSRGGNIVLNAYLDSKSYSLNGRSQSGGDISVTARAGSITGNTINNNQTNIVTSAVSTENASNLEANAISERDRGRRSGNVRLTARDSISGFNIFTLANQDDSGDVRLRGIGNLQVENVQVITNEEVIVGSFDFDESPFFPSNSVGEARDSDTAVTVNRPETGAPGKVFISSSGSLSATNLFVSNNANSDTEVGAGDVRIASPGDITLIDSLIETDSVTAGDGGTIRIVDSQRVILDNTALRTGTDGAGRAGSILVDGFDYLLLRNGSLLLADAAADEDGGTVRIGSSRVIASPDGNNDIITNASSGDGGSIFSPNATLYGFTLQSDSTTAQLRNSRSNDISTRSEFGQDGSLEINDITETPNQTESEALDDSFSTPEQLISNSCISPANGSVAGSFTIPGTGDLPPTPADSTASVYALGDVQTLPSERTADAHETAISSGNTLNNAVHASKQDWELGDPIVEPESIARLADGRIAFGQSCSVL